MSRVEFYYLVWKIFKHDNTLGWGYASTNIRNVGYARRHRQ